MGLLDDKVVLVTGAARGQGEAEAQRAVAEGATVFVADVLDELGARTAGAMGAHDVHLDVTSPEDWQKAVADVVSRHGHLDGLGEQRRGVGLQRDRCRTRPATAPARRLTVDGGVHS